MLGEVYTPILPSPAPSSPPPVKRLCSFVPSISLSPGIINRPSFKTDGTTALGHPWNDTAQSSKMLRASALGGNLSPNPHHPFGTSYAKPCLLRFSRTSGIDLASAHAGQ